MKNIENRGNLPSGNVLMVHPPYAHYSGEFIRDSAPFLPLGLLYAGQILGEYGIEYHDCQLQDINERDFGDYDSIGVNVMGTQNIAPAYKLFTSLLERRIDPNRIYLGGQGVEGLEPSEFESIFPNANQVARSELIKGGYWNVSIREQLEKLPEEDLETYLENELTLLFSQGCQYSCTWCGAQTGMLEGFYDTEENLRTYFDRAKEFGITNLDTYVTSLDFFQQALKGGDTERIKKRLRDIINLKEEYGIDLRLRALTRANSYVSASEDEELMDLVKEAGFYQFGFGGDGAANKDIQKAMNKGTTDLKSDILKSFKHMEKKGFIPEILYVFGIKEDTEETLRETRDLCTRLLDHFPSLIYRGFPAKDNILGNLNWRNPEWKESEAYRKLLANPELFVNLGFETLANIVSHPDEEKRRLVNQCAVEMSHYAHELGRVQSFLTVPIMESDGHELMDENSFEMFKDIVSKYAPEISSLLTLENLPNYREKLNQLIPKDT
tara:strand:+ start:1165 stop:2652 length:1488 start_codon:yes stop_codon:yes gene_type:complete